MHNPHRVNVYDLEAQPRLTASSGRILLLQSGVSPRSAAPRFQIDSSDAFYPPLWEDDWKSRGIGVGHTVPETDYSLGGGVALVNVVRGTTSSHINRGGQSNSPRLRMSFGTPYSCPLERMVNGAQSADFSLQEQDIAGLDPRRGRGADDVIGCELSMRCACLVMMSSAISLITRLPGAHLTGPRTTFTRPQSHAASAVCHAALETTVF